ncbi:RNA binding motif protein 12Ba [Anoplopoma fimbria]|uniref:RNA binding motif protein 12Ba n=1 Tax=Anoplopoma fimbria TaxID=229290 RepID=UPI0023ED31B9|nr:RNA binding motif protein 12Ba [Anoplopoma fimbria]
MTVILRLQGLDVKARTGDIRTFFEGLHIPDGGVYIVGGRLREAFIAFTSERNAQLAMRYSGKFLKGSKVTLHISSMAEMEHKLKSSLKRKKPSPTQPTVKRRPSTTDLNVQTFNAQPLNPNTANLPLNPDIANLPLLNAHSLDSNTAFLLGVCTVLQGLHSSLQSENNVAVPSVDFPKADGTVVCEEMRTQKQTLDSGPGYVRVFGLPASATDEVINHFFKGLMVEEAMVNVELGLNRGCLVKFANMQDARAALLFNQRSLGPVCVDVRGATEKMWASALQECETTFEVGERGTPKQRPVGGTVNHKQKKTSTLTLKRTSVNQLQSKSQKEPRSTTPTMEYIIMVTNIPKTMTKTEIKELFGCQNIAHKNVQHLLDEEGIRTDTAFLIFNRTEDYEYAMNLTGCHVGSEAIEVSSITKQMMWDMMAKTHHRGLEHCPNTGTKNKPNRRRNSNPFETPEEEPSMKLDPTAKTRLFLRNMPEDVKVHHIQRLFSKYKVRKDDIMLLHDSDGKGTGQAVVQFKSQNLAALAQRLHGQTFLGTKVLLTLISWKQLADILA